METIVREFANSIMLDVELHSYRFTKIIFGLFSTACEVALIETNKNEFKVFQHYYGPFYRAKYNYIFQTESLDAFRFIRRVMY